MIDRDGNRPPEIPDPTTADYLKVVLVGVALVAAAYLVVR